jgi:hypothetical protein
MVWNLNSSLHSWTVPFFPWLLHPSMNPPSPPSQQAFNSWIVFCRLELLPLGLKCFLIPASLNCFFGPITVSAVPEQFPPSLNSFISRLTTWSIPELIPPSQNSFPLTWNVSYNIYRVGRSIVDYFLRVRRRRRWGLWAERLAKSPRQRPKLLRKYSGGDERTRCRRGVHLPPRHHSELCAELKNMKIFEGLSNSKNMVVNVKKLLHVGVGLTLRRKGGKNRWERNERQI